MAFLKSMNIEFQFQLQTKIFTEFELEIYFSLSYYLNPWWTRAYSRQQEIYDYLEDLANKFGLNPYIQFKTRVLTANWDESQAQWIVKTDNGKEFKGNFLFSGAGGLHVPNDTRFKGKPYDKSCIL